jgi:aspartate oxidase
MTMDADDTWQQHVADMVDSTTTPIEIAPTAHYSMGGVWVRPEVHGTDVEGLFAIGEASSGLHRANRLGGNSLTTRLRQDHRSSCSRILDCTQRPTTFPYGAFRCSSIRTAQG